jgi:hypothetical protein
MLLKRAWASAQSMSHCLGVDAAAASSFGLQDNDAIDAHEDVDDEEFDHGCSNGASANIAYALSSTA